MGLSVVATGFSAAAHAVTNTSAAAYTEAARIEDRHLPQGQPWSPAGKQLAVAGSRSLALWDAAQVEAPPRVILDAEVLEVRWSPDGTWLCCRVRVMNGTRGGAVRFQFVPAAGGDAEYRIPNAGIGNWTWADDGKLYYWDAQTGVRKELATPSRWLATQPQLPAMPRPELIFGVSTDRRHPRARPLLFQPGAAPTESLVDSLFKRRAVRPWSRVQQPASTDLGWIVTVQDGGPGETMVVNARGGRLCALQPEGEPALQFVSASTDGKVVAGERCAAADTARACARIWVGSLDAHSFTAMTWDGRNPCVDPQGRWIAFDGKATRAVHVMQRRAP